MRKFFGGVLGVALLAVLSFFGYDLMDEAPVLIGIKNLEVEVFGDVDLLADVSYEDRDNDLVIVVDDSKLDLDTVGTYEVIYSIVDSKGQVSQEMIVVSVVDTVNPEIVGETEFDLNVGDSFNLDEYISATDNYDVDGEILSKTGDIDLTTPGEYIVIYTAEDSSGNISEHTVVVNVTYTPKQILVNDYQAELNEDELYNASYIESTYNFSNGIKQVQEIVQGDMLQVVTQTLYNDDMSSYIKYEISQTIAGDVVLDYTLYFVAGDQNVVFVPKSLIDGSPLSYIADVVGLNSEYVKVSFEDTYEQALMLEVLPELFRDITFNSMFETTQPYDLLEDSFEEFLGIDFDLYNLDLSDLLYELLDQGDLYEVEMMLDSVDVEGIEEFFWYDVFASDLKYDLTYNTDFINEIENNGIGTVASILSKLEVEEGLFVDYKIFYESLTSTELDAIKEAYFDIENDIGPLNVYLFLKVAYDDDYGQYILAEVVSISTIVILGNMQFSPSIDMYNDVLEEVYYYLDSEEYLNYKLEIDDLLIAIDNGSLSAFIDDAQIDDGIEDLNYFPPLIIVVDLIQYNTPFNFDMLIGYTEIVNMNTADNISHITLSLLETLRDYGSKENLIDNNYVVVDTVIDEELNIHTSYSVHPSIILDLFTSMVESAGTALDNIPNPGIMSITIQNVNCEVDCMLTFAEYDLILSTLESYIQSNDQLFTIVSTTVNPEDSSFLVTKVTLTEFMESIGVMVPIEITTTISNGEMITLPEGSDDMVSILYDASKFILVDTVHNIVAEIETKINYEMTYNNYTYTEKTILFSDLDYEFSYYGNLSHFSLSTSSITLIGDGTEINFLIDLKYVDGTDVFVEPITLSELEELMLDITLNYDTIITTIDSDSYSIAKLILLVYSDNIW